MSSGAAYTVLPVELKYSTAVLSVINVKNLTV